MSNIKIELKNKKQIERVFKKAPNELAKALQIAIEQTGGTTVGKVKQVIRSGTGMYRPPLKTGAMMRGVHISQKSPLRVVIEPNLKITPYAEDVHYGTKRMRPRPFMTITKQTEEKNIVSFFSRTINKFINELANKLK